MNPPKLTLTILAATLTLSASPATSPPSTDGPPGTVRIKGGRTKVGTEKKDLIKLLETNPPLLKNAGSFLSEVPQHTVDVDDFFLMVSEVTNEQYEAYVTATSARPPHSWGDKAIAAAIEVHLEEQEKLRKAAKDAGEPPPARVAFDKPDWWAKNWRDAEWEVTEKMKNVPVIYIDYQDARGYAEWAGLRLPEESEYERAVRGNSDRVYPWDDPWKTGEFAATNEIRGVSEIYPVGSFPAGATEDGIFDLAGNVWEWTQSKYVPYPGWKHKKFDIGQGRRKKTIDAIPAWSPDFRVVRGGSQQNSRFYSRCTTRGGFDRFQRASALGFRCAASVTPGLDFARSRLDEIPREIRPVTEKGPVDYDTGQVLAKDRWHSATGTATVPKYGVITGYDYILFTPAAEIATSGVSDIRKGTQTDDLFHIGFLATNQELIEPVLPAGTYLVALRGQGPIPERGAKAAKPEEEGEGEEGEGGQDPDPAPATPQEGEEKLLVDEHITFDPAVDNFIFIDMTGKPVVAVPVGRIDYVNPTPSRLAVLDKTIQIPAPGEEGKKKPKMVDLTQQWLDLDLFIKGKSRKGVKALLSLRFKEGLFDLGSWR